MNNLDFSKYDNKTSTSTLSHDEWNTVLTKIQDTVNSLITASAASSNTSNSSIIYVNGVKTDVTNGILTLTSGAKYVLSGTLYGKISITASDKDNDDTRLVLDGLDIISTQTTGIELVLPSGITSNNGYNSLVINLTKDSINNIVCTTVAAIADEQLAAIYSAHKLTIQGLGYLNCINKGGHGVRATTLDLVGPKMYIEASHDGLHAGNALNLLAGNFYVNKSKDAFGTSTDGIINIFGGSVYAYNIEENVFDGKGGINIYEAPKILGTSIDTASIYSGTVKNYAINASTLLSTGTITLCSDKTFTETATIISLDESTQTYKITASGGTELYYKITGYIAHPIIINTPDNTDVAFGLSNAYISTSLADTPSIYYYTSDKGKVKLVTIKDTINSIINTVKTTTNTSGINAVDIDAVKSENNISIESKSGSVLYISSAYGDGLDGGDVKFTDSKGYLICNNCGSRGIKGNCIVIGPNAKTDKSVISSYYTDSTDTDNYSETEGSVICINNCVHNDIGVGKTEASTDYKNYGFADIYCRNGKYTKGVFGTRSDCLKGVIITGSIAAVVGMDFNKSQNIFYTNIVSSGSNGITSDCGKTFDQFYVIPYKKAPIIK